MPLFINVSAEKDNKGVVLFSQCPNKQAVKQTADAAVFHNTGQGWSLSKVGAKKSLVIICASDAVKSLQHICLVGAEAADSFKLNCQRVESKVSQSVKIALSENIKPVDKSQAKLINSKISIVVVILDGMGDAGVVYTVEIQRVGDKQKTVRVFQNLGGLQSVLAAAYMEIGGEIPVVKA